MRVSLSGWGVHTGRPVTVGLARAEGPVRLVRDGAAAAVDELSLAGAERSTRVAGRGLELATVEHLFGALAGLSVRAGVRVEVDGPELPLLGGGAAEYAAALRALEVTSAPPRLHVAREGTVEVAGSRYAFAPGPGTVVEVTIDFGDPRLHPGARFEGDAEDFVTRIAPARTFAFAHEVEALGQAGLARHASPESVIVVGDVIHARGGAAPDEPARHKLLDLLGDAYLHGGPPRGVLRAHRPGHARNHEAFARALAAGILAVGAGPSAASAGAPGATG